MKIVVVGSSGLLGACLVSKLRDYNYDLILPSSSRKNELKCDFTRKDDVDNLIKSANPDMIINLAALTNVDQCEADPVYAYQLNSQIPLNISNAIKSFKKNIGFIQISTDQVYQSSGYSSENDISPLNVYTYSKLLGEAYAENALVLRTNFIGKSSCKERVSFSDWIYNSLSSGQTIPLFHDSVFSPLSINHLCGAISFCIQNYSSGVYNLGAIGSMSKYEFGLQFAEKIGLDVSLIQKKSMDDVTLKAKRPRSMAMNSEKFINDFKYDLPTINQVLSTVIKGYENE